MDQDLLESTLFVIPCYNEETRIQINKYGQSLIKNPQVKILFVNDGSSDNTLEVLEKLRSEFKSKVDILDLEKNSGKAEAVRAGMQYQLNKNEDLKYIGYLDADLATSLEEGLRLSRKLSNNDQLKFAFGSRILIVGSKIDRKTYRHIIGRIIGTFISNILHLAVYDTQCGAKVFTIDLAKYVFQGKFISKWLFDVEIFARMLSSNQVYGEENMIEVPLNEWIDQDGSKVQMSYGIKVFFDLLRIRSSYPELKTRKMN